MPPQDLIEAELRDQVIARGSHDKLDAAKRRGRKEPYE